MKGVASLTPNSLSYTSLYSEVDVFHSRIRGHTQPQFSTAEKFQDLAASVMKDISFQELEYYHRVQKSDTDTLEKFASIFQV